jgi:hypothetical protein
MKSSIGQKIAKSLQKACKKPAKSLQETWELKQVIVDDRDLAKLVAAARED